MAVATTSTTIKFHNFPSGRVEYHYEPTTTAQQIDGPIRSISWSKDGNWLALVPYTGYAEIISIKNKLKTIHTIESFVEPSCVAFQNTTKKNVVIGTRGGQVYLYDIKSRNVKKTFTKATSMVTQVEFSIKDNYIVANYGNGIANLFSNVTNTLVSVLKMPKTHLINTIKMNPIKRNLIVGGSKDGAVNVWDINTNKVRFFKEIHKAPVCSTIFSPIHSDLILSTGLDRQFCFYDINSKECIKTVSVDNCMMSADFSPDGKHILMGSQSGKVYVYDSRKLDETLNVFIAHNSSIKHLAFKRNEENDVSITSSMDCVVKSTNESKPEPQQQNNESINFGYISVESPTNDQHQTGIEDDSFMAKIGLDRNKMFDTVNDDVDRPILSPITPQLPVNHVKVLQLTDQQHSSTPTIPTSTKPLTISPKSTTKLCKCKIEIDNVVIRDIIREELHNIVDEVKTEIKYKYLDIKDEMRSLHLSRMMAHVKESIKVENAFNNLRDELVDELPQNLEALYQENLALKQKIAELERQLALN